MLYELVMGGLLATAFLPVYLSVKKREGKARSEEYASNLLTIVVLGLGIVSLLCMVFPAQVIYTQTFYSNQEEMDLSIFLFQFFAIQVVFYGASSIVSGLLNANRNYLPGAIAPVFNNIIVIVTFLAYAFIAPTNQTLAFYIIAVGNPLGVFVQMAIQIPALRRCGIKLRPRIDLHDPALRETVQIGLPALFVTICSFATVSVSNAASYCFADNGPSVIAYARLWFTFPYSFLTIPVATAMFTELSDMQADGNTRGVIRGIVSGSNQIFFLMIPFAFYLIVFSVPLVTLYHMGAFTDDSITQIASYLAVMAVALPFYGVNTYLQMVFSSIRKMGVFFRRHARGIACPDRHHRMRGMGRAEQPARHHRAHRSGNDSLLPHRRRAPSRISSQAFREDGPRLHPPQLSARIRARSRRSCSRRSCAMGRELRRPPFGLDSASVRLHRRRRHREPSHHVRARR